MSHSLFQRYRQEYHAALLEGPLTFNGTCWSNADSSSNSSKTVAHLIAHQIANDPEVIDKKAGQALGADFERATVDYVHKCFSRLGHLRPGTWQFYPGTNGDRKTRLSIANFEQYAHLFELARLSKEHDEIKLALGNDYIITPDLLIARQPEPDEAINLGEELVGDDVALKTSLRAFNSEKAILHASISCKWTLRSDRAQNARTEALNLIRNRKGHLPHVVVATAEPMPTRLASLALGTGDIDCVYHFALPEMQAALAEAGLEDQAEVLDTLVEGKRLKDISDLPLDLAV